METRTVKKVGVHELKSNLSDYLCRVEEGETIVITRHGKTIGRIVPEYTSLDIKIEDLLKSGFLHWGGKVLSAWDPIAVNKGQVLVSDLVNEECDKLPSP